MTSSRYDTTHDTKDDKSAKAKAGTRATMPVGGTIVSAARDYSVLSATKDAAKPEVPVVFAPGMPVVAWSIGADGAAFPVTAAPVDAAAVATGTLQVDGRVLGDDGVLYAGALEWQAAVRAADAPVIEAAAVEAKVRADEAKAKVDAAAVKAKADEEAAKAKHKVA